MTVWLLSFNMNNKINDLHERSLHIVYKGSNSSFKNLLEIDSSFTVHHRNIQSLAINLFKIKENLQNTIMNDVLQTRTLTYNLRSQIDCKEFYQHQSFWPEFTLLFCLKSLEHIKIASRLHVFKSKIRKREPKESHCNLCRLYVSNLWGFVILV